MADTVSQADIDALARAMAALPRPAAAAATAAGGSPLQVFCDNWPNLKNILTTIQPIVGSIPGFGAVLSGAISTILLIGGAAYSAFCGGH